MHLRKLLAIEDLEIDKAAISPALSNLIRDYKAEIHRPDAHERLRHVLSKIGSNPKYEPENIAAQRIAAAASIHRRLSLMHSNPQISRKDKSNLRRQMRLVKKHGAQALDDLLDLVYRRRPDARDHTLHFSWSGADMSRGKTKRYGPYLKDWSPGLQAHDFLSIIGESHLRPTSIGKERGILRFESHYYPKNKGRGIYKIHGEPKAAIHFANLVRAHMPNVKVAKAISPKSSRRPHVIVVDSMNNPGSARTAMGT